MLGCDRESAVAFSPSLFLHKMPNQEEKALTINIYVSGPGDARIFACLRLFSQGNTHKINNFTLI